MKVLLVEDHTIISQMFADAIGILPEFEVVGQATSFEAAVTLYRKHSPDVIVLDLNLDNSSGFELLNLLRDDASPARCLIFSGITTPPVLQRALSLGASGVVEKAGTLDQLIEALRTVAAGGTYLSPGIRKQLARFGERPNASPEIEKLTQREREVLLHVANGLSNKETASRLGISVHTVENHRASLIRKTGVQSQAKLTMLAIQLGLIQPS